MIPETAVFIISNNDHRIFTIRSVKHIIDQFNSMAFACCYIGITRMFIINTQWFYK